MSMMLKPETKVDCFSLRTKIKHLFGKYKEISPDDSIFSKEYDRIKSFIIKASEVQSVSVDNIYTMLLGLSLKGYSLERRNNEVVLTKYAGLIRREMIELIVYLDEKEKP